jgi:hypothetical protein
MISAHAGGDHAVHLGFAIFCIGVVVFCIVAAKFTSPPKRR